MPGQRRAWWSALAIALVMLIALDWLLARLLWLPYFFGLFFFLIAGLIVAGLSFRVARSARPISTWRVVRGILLLAVLNTIISLQWEYRFVASTIGEPPRFVAARNRAIREGRSPREIDELAADAFRKGLKADYAPGGMIGYVKWALHSGEMILQLPNATESTSIEPSGGLWVIRTLTEMLLLAAGLWLSYDGLRFASPVSNILPAGEEYEEIA